MITQFHRLTAPVLSFMIENIFVFPPYVWLYCIFVAFILGLVFGSFGNAWAYRIVHGERIEQGRSHCPVCGHTLSVRDLVPLFSYIFLKGRCRYCKARISLRYPVAELCCGLGFVAALLAFGITVRMLLLWALVLIYLVLSLVDWESMVIPDFLVAGAAVVSVLYYSSGLPAISGKSLGIRLLAALLLAGGLLVIVLIADRVLKKESMGGGDIKLIFSVGLAAGLTGGVLSLFIACILGLIFAFFAHRDVEKGDDLSEKNAFPFGPFICISSLLVLLYGDSFIRWYLNLIF